MTPKAGIRAPIPAALSCSRMEVRVSPRRIQARHEVNELPDRELMRDGRWLI